MRVTLRDIAKRVNLSHASVSFVLNGRMDVSIPTATRERVLVAAKEMGYAANRAAQALVRGRTNMVALWLPLGDSALHARVQYELARLAVNDGFELVTRLFDFGRIPGESKWEVDDWPVDGVLMLDCHRPTHAQFSAPAGVPLVSLGARYDTGYDHVGIDLAVGVREAMAHLMAAGCRRIAHLTCGADSPGDPVFAAYLADCHGHRLKPEFIAAKSCSRHGAREAVAGHISAGGAPEAILAQTDELAISAIGGLTGRDVRVPGDVLLVGCNGSDEGEFASPSLTSIAQPVAEMCRRSWDVLRRRMGEVGTAGAGDPGVGSVHSEILAAGLIVRESSMRPG